MEGNKNCCKNIYPCLDVVANGDSEDTQCKISENRRGTCAWYHSCHRMCCSHSYLPDKSGCPNGILDFIWTILMVYFCFRQEQFQLYDLDYREAREKAVEEEVVANDFVAAIFDNKLFEKPHES